MEFDQDQARQLAALQARINRIETLLQQLLTVLATSQQSAGQTAQVQRLLQELRSSPDTQADTPADQQEQPEMQAIRQALLVGDRRKAIQLYRGLYGVSLQEAQTALDALHQTIT